MNLHKQIPSPVGPIYLVADSKFLRAITFATNWPAMSPGKATTPSCQRHRDSLKNTLQAGEPILRCP